MQVSALTVCSAHSLSKRTLQQPFLGNVVVVSLKGMEEDIQGCGEYSHGVREGERDVAIGWRGHCRVGRMLEVGEMRFHKGLECI